jgi:hypothetical protein
MLTLQLTIEKLATKSKRSFQMPSQDPNGTASVRVATHSTCLPSLTSSKKSCCHLMSLIRDVISHASPSEL